ncbi:DUF3397 domain-containing protein [Paenibacillus sp. IB182496]|uniref:DUF3397 domain-containing protein n=1 Tax=Paenibacillus sabuli TaxID=2772509 RepID=A0A927GQL7_9BACL|nr:DUF3397 domain-containing protein [Paenibacillus sabuli]MBD2844411.1 DUF3397 domain-containing protein [Paenibacillus sabuli]
MQWLWDGLVQTYAILAIVPVVPFALIYAGYAAYVGDRKKAIRLAMDVTTPLLIGCVSVLFNQIFNSGFGFYGILLLMLLGGGLLGNLQYRTKGKLDARRIVRAVWRIGFFAMSAMYVLLMAIGVIGSLWRI